MVDGVTMNTLQMVWKVAELVICEQLQIEKVVPRMSTTANERISYRKSTYEAQSR
jgi:hypothetical protein